jgi:hypothetical protein
MSDPRNVAHDKKVKQEKEHQAESSAAEEKEQTTAATTAAPADSATHEKSVTVLSKLKEMEFHSRANIETLAEMTLTIEDELKQKEFSDPIGELYATQDQFRSKVADLIEKYEAHVDSLKPAP